MQPIKTRTLLTTLLATSLPVFCFARTPAPVAAASYSALAGTGSAMQQDDAKPQQDETKQKDTDSKPSKAEKQDEPAKQDKADKPPKQNDQDQKQMEPAKQPKPDEMQKPKDEGQNQDKKAEQQDQDRNQAKQDQKDEYGQPGASGRRVSDKDLKAHFGQEHKFSVRHVVTTTTIVPNQTQFVYTGYTFVFADPWPAGWALEDDCYIDYDDGEYFMIDLDHPGVRIALTIVG
jgi:type IV secretory pathway VirB10-like protein